MPIVPNLLERLVLFRLNRGPGAIIDLFGAGAVRAAVLADDLGVYSALDDGPTPLAELADRVDAVPDGLEPLLEFLVATGYLRATTHGYANTAMTETWLRPTGRADITPWLRFWEELAFPFWADNLERAVREGGPERTLYEFCGDDEDRWALTQRGFESVADLLAGDVANALDVAPGDTRLVDVGGGHGRYAIELCRRHPALSATVVDDPNALAVARENIAEAGLTDRVSVEGADYRTDPLGEGYDVALCFNVIHAHDAAENRALFSAVADALSPGGRIAVLDQLEGSAPTPVGEAGLRFVGLTYLVTLGAEVHPYAAVADWLTEAGFSGVERTTFRAAPGTALVQATKG